MKNENLTIPLRQVTKSSNAFGGQSNSKQISHALLTPAENILLEKIRGKKDGSKR